MTTRDERPWGWFEILSEAPDHKVKRLVVQPGRRTSLQRHKHRREHWIVVSGVATVELEGREHTLTVGEHIDIPQGEVHRLSNRGDAPVAIIETQTGSYFGEDDIERVSDDFGRA